MKKLLVFCFALFMVQAYLKAQNCDEFDKAKDAYEHLTGGYEQIRHMTVDEQKRLVDAMCNADDDEIKAVGKSAAERIQEDMESNIDNLVQQKNDAESAIEAVENNQQCQEKLDDVKEYQERIDEIWPRIERITEIVKAGNNPVFKTMSALGQEAHQVMYQNAHSSEGIAEFQLPSSGKIDFISFNCEVIELKSNNSSSKYKGRKEAADYAKELNNKDGSAFKKLIEKEPKFAACKEFIPVVMCYQACPEISDDGEMHLSDLDWTKD